MNEIPALTTLAERFDTAARHAPRRQPAARRPITLIAITATAALAAFAAGAVTRPERVVAGAPLALVDNKLAVSYEQVLDDPGDVESQLASAGVRVSIRHVPASPSMVGRVRWSQGTSPIGDSDVERPTEPWVVPSCDDPRVCVPWWPNGVAPTDTPQGFEAGLLIPLDYDGETEIWVGRAADPDEPYAMDTRPFAAGEALACQPILLAPVPEARSMLAGVSTPIVWRLNDTLPPGQLRQVDPDNDGDIDDLDAAADLVVEDAAYLTDHSVLLWVRRSAPTDWTDADRQAAHDQATMLENLFAAGC